MRWLPRTDCLSPVRARSSASLLPARLPLPATPLYIYQVRLPTVAGFCPLIWRLRSVLLCPERVLPAPDRLNIKLRESRRPTLSCLQGLPSSLLAFSSPRPWRVTLFSLLWLFPLFSIFSARSLSNRRLARSVHHPINRSTPCYNLFLPLLYSQRKSRPPQ